MKQHCLPVFYALQDISVCKEQLIIASTFAHQDTYVQLEHKILMNFHALKEHLTITHKDMVIFLALPALGECIVQVKVYHHQQDCAQVDGTV